MKNFFILIAFILASIAGANAQQNNQEGKGCKHSQIMAEFMEEKKLYLKQCIPLSDDEAEKFFALYDELEKKKFETSIPTFREARKIKNSSEVVSNDDYVKIADKLASLSTEIAAIESEYYAKIKQILTPKQMFMFFICEHSFGKSMLRKKQDQ